MAYVFDKKGWLVYVRHAHTTLCVVQGVPYCGLKEGALCETLIFPKMKRGECEACCYEDLLVLDRKDGWWVCANCLMID